VLCFGIAVLPAAAEDATVPEPVTQTQEETAEAEPVTQTQEEPAEPEPTAQTPEEPTEPAAPEEDAAYDWSPYEVPDWRAYENREDYEYDFIEDAWLASVQGQYYLWTRVRNLDTWGVQVKFDRAFRSFYADDPLLVIDNHIVYLKTQDTDWRGRKTGETYLTVIDFFDTDETEAKTTKLRIPAAVGDLPVRGIYMGRMNGDWGYTSMHYSNDTVKSIVIEASMTAVGSFAFANFTALKKVTLPETVETIGKNAFDSCASLRRIVCNGAIKKICDDAFFNCENLDFRVPATIEWIGWDAFRNSGIKKAVLPLSARLESTEEAEEGDHTFADCKQLTSVRFTGGEDTVWYQTSNAMFGGCTALKTVVLPTAFKKMILSSGTFSGCTALETIRNLNCVESIEEMAFRGCTGLRELTIPKEIEFIHETAFQGCKGLRSLTLESKDPAQLNDRDYPPQQMQQPEPGNFVKELPKKCTVYVANKDMKYAVKSHGFPGTVKIRVDVPTPKTAKVTKQNGKVTFKWSKVTKADGYRIWSYNPKTGKYTKLATVKAPQTTVTLKSNAKQFVLRAYRIEAGDVSWSAIMAFK
jgi:hypothetical protein